MAQSYNVVSPTDSSFSIPLKITLWSTGCGLLRIYREQDMTGKVDLPIPWTSSMWISKEIPELAHKE